MVEKAGNREQGTGNRWRFVLLLLVFYSLFPIPYSLAQFLGYTSPQTVGPITCLNAVSAPATSSSTPGNAAFIPALGQSVHYLTYTTSGTITTMSIQLDASFNNTTFFRVSETASSPGSGAVSANVYYPFMRCNLTAITGGGSVTAIYTGTSVSAGPPSGIFNSSGIFNKTLATAANAALDATYDFPIPTGNSGGTIYLTYNAVASTSTIVVRAGIDSSQLTNVIILVPINNTRSAFSIPSQAANVGQVAYAPGGGIGTYDLSYSFGGSSNTSATLVVNPSLAIPTICDLQQDILLSVAGNTQVLAGSGQSRIAICHISFSSTAMTDITFTRGTGVNCAGSAATLMGPYKQVLTMALDFGISPMLVGGGANFCINQGSAVTTGGGFTYARF